MQEAVYSRLQSTDRDVCPSVSRDISVRFSAGIRRAGSKRSLKVPPGFPDPDRLRPASQYFSNFLSKSYGTRSIMTSREQSSFSLLAVPLAFRSRKITPRPFSLYARLLPSSSLRQQCMGMGNGVGKRSEKEGWGRGINNHSG